MDNTLVLNEIRLYLIEKFERRIDILVRVLFRRTLQKKCSIKHLETFGHHNSFETRFDRRQHRLHRSVKSKINDLAVKI